MYTLSSHGFKFRVDGPLSVFFRSLLLSAFMFLVLPWMSIHLFLILFTSRCVELQAFTLKKIMHARLKYERYHLTVLTSCFPDPIIHAVFIKDISLRSRYKSLYYKCIKFILYRLQLKNTSKAQFNPALRNLTSFCEGG